MERQVLVVEDDPDIGNLIAIRLKKHGYETIRAGNGAEAVSAFEQFQPRVIVTDWMMPVLTGLEMCAHIRRTAVLPQPHVIMVSARTTTTDQDQARAVGVDDFLLKPISFPDLLEKVDAAFAA